jgi:hypothetical protein
MILVNPINVLGLVPVIDSTAKDIDAFLFYNYHIVPMQC